MTHYLLIQADAEAYMYAQHEQVGTLHIGEGDCHWFNHTVPARWGKTWLMYRLGRQPTNYQQMRLQSGLRPYFEHTTDVDYAANPHGKASS